MYSLFYSFVHSVIYCCLCQVTYAASSKCKTNSNMWHTTSTFVWTVFCVLFIIYTYSSFYSFFTSKGGEAERKREHTLSRFVPSYMWQIEWNQNIALHFIFSVDKCDFCPFFIVTISVCIFGTRTCFIFFSSLVLLSSKNSTSCHR